MNPLTTALVLREYGSNYERSDVRQMGGAGGFSGSTLWRCSTTAGDFCLKRWPDRTRLADLTRIHALLQHVFTCGMPIVPVPVVNLYGSTATSFHGSLWELAPWLNGEPKLHVSPTATRLINAIHQVAQFHEFAGQLEESGTGPSPGLQQRLVQLQQWRTDRWREARQALRARGWSELEARGQLAFDLFQRTADEVEQQLQGALRFEVPLQICIRDLRAEHILFSGDDVSGIVDFGASRVESPVGDLARLVGTVGELANKWEIALETYCTRRSLSDGEKLLLPVFHRSGIVLGALNWIWWVAVEKRIFENWRAVLDRLDVLLQQWSEL